MDTSLTSVQWALILFFAAGGKNIALNYDSFTAYAGPGYSYDDSRKNCQLTLSVRVPWGYQFALDKFSHDASYAIGSYVTGSFKTTYYFQATLNEAHGDGTISGPAKFDNALTGSFSPLIWSPCGQNAVVGINTEVRVDNGNNNSAYGSLTIRNTTVSFVEPFRHASYPENPSGTLLYGEHAETLAIMIHDSP